MSVQICVVISFYVWTRGICTTNSTPKHTVEDDYYLNYDYEISNGSDSFLLPNPGSVDSRYTVDALPEVELPDDSLSDTDLKDHDFIDNLMYVYYGSHNKNRNSYGPRMIIVGSVLSCAAQILTFSFVALRKNSSGKKGMKCLFLHLLASSFFSNFIFVLGVYTTKNSLRCLMVALILHYAHLLTSFWIFLYCFYIYQRFVNSDIPKGRYFVAVGYGVPLIFSIISYLVSPHSFETKLFCFMSVQKGMIVNYMFPVSLLIVTTTICSLNGIRRINVELSKLEFGTSSKSLMDLRSEFDDRKADYNDEEIIVLKELKTCLKLLCGTQTSYDIVWFISVLALENDTDDSMSFLYSLTSCLLNWFILIKVKSFLPNVYQISHLINNIILSHDQYKSNAAEDSVPRRGSSDNIPLLLIVEDGAEMREMRLDYISTISN